MPFRSVDAFEDFIRENEGVIILDERTLGNLRVTALDVIEIMKM